MHYILSNDITSLIYLDIKNIYKTIISNTNLMYIYLAIELISIITLIFFSSNKKNIYYSQQVELTPKIKIPKPIGQGQYGTNWWLNKKDYKNIFSTNIIETKKDYNEICMKSGGIITHFENDGVNDKVYYIDENLHTLLVGSTGSGKSRSIIIPTIAMLGLAGENMCISDVKGELYLYTEEKLKELGYNVIAIDYINFLKSNKYNYLDIVINAIEEDNISLAETLISDLVNILVEKNEKTEPIWKNGEISVIKTAIMAVLLENKGKREYQTLPNVYYFIAEMFKEKNGRMPIDQYMDKKPADDPIKKFYAIAGTAPSKTRGSFVSVALSTMQMFVDDYVANNIQSSDFDIKNFAREKTAIFILLPDDRETYHRLASILVKQIYTSLVECSRKDGGELKVRMNFLLDEFANFTKIDGFQSMLTVARGRNIRFIICVQSLLSQIEEKYGKEGAQNILDNCMWIYLKSANIETASKISEKLGTYTAQSYGESSNSNNKNDKTSSSMSLISRKLLTPDEVLTIENPYALVMIAGKPPAITEIPDISKMNFNKILGMGDREYNQNLRITRENERKIYDIAPIKVWDIWNKENKKDIKVIQDNFKQRIVENEKKK